MDPHFHEYLAAVAAMHEIYGDLGDEQCTEFHDDPAGVVAGELTTSASA